MVHNRRGSREPCGLKYSPRVIIHLRRESRLARALWIEIAVPEAVLTDTLTSRLARALWIEIYPSIYLFSGQSRRGSREPCGLKLLITVTLSIIVASRLARALWIEIAVEVFGRRYLVVEARESLVD